jgi:hypothetical protein
MDPIMNIKSNHLLCTLLAAVTLSAFAGTASAADACTEIQAHVSSNPNKVEAALFSHFGGGDHLVRLGRNNGDFDFMRLRKAGNLSQVKGCTIRYSALAQKYTPRFDGQVGVAAPKPERTRGGKVDWRIEFDASQGTKLLIKKQHIITVNWKGEGAVKEKIFRNANGNKTYFGGSLN